MRLYALIGVKKNSKNRMNELSKLGDLFSLCLNWGLAILSLVGYD